MLLHLESLNKIYQSNGKTIDALKDVSLQLDSGQFCSLQGKSGCGKSTLLLTAGGLLRPDRGRVVIDGQDLYAMSPNERAAFRAAHIGFVFQQFHLVPYLSVLDNVLTASLGTLGSDARAVRGRALELTERFGLTDRRKHLPAQLSTGERQRTALARALLNRPRLLLADEPTGNLDDENSRIVLRHLDQFAQDGGAVLLVTHDSRATQLAPRQLTMVDGNLISAAPAAANQ
jgi:ABC-type lipoprotein export system ATPase subunit